MAKLSGIRYFVRNLEKSECHSSQSPFPASTKNESALGFSSSGIARSSNLGYESRGYDSAESEFMYRHRLSALLSHRNEPRPVSETAGHG